jgi:predicted DNA-binding transcriptional regulator AlpA
MSFEKSPGAATNEDLCKYLNVGDDKRAEILTDLGLPKRREHDWTTIWAAIGIAPVQRRKLWDELRMPLLDVAQVADIVGRRPKTISGWCHRGEYPAGFPLPFDFGPRTKRWIGLEVWAYQQPALYAGLARRIARPSPSSRKLLQKPATGAPLPTTLDPLPIT